VVHDAVCRNLEIIGEAARRFDDAFRVAHAEIPWRAMTDVRNILIHAYDRVVAKAHSQAQGSGTLRASKVTTLKDLTGYNYCSMPVCLGPGSAAHAAGVLRQPPPSAAAT
jgi:hypothetical protein